MSLRPLIEIAAESERVHALAGRVREATGGAEAVTVRASTMLRPLLLAALLQDDRGLAGGPALLVSADDRSARDLAAHLRAPRARRAWPPPPPAPPATSPPTCAPTWPRAWSASTPRAEPATPPT